MCWYVVQFIIWQGSFEVNASIVIGSFLVGIYYANHFYGSCLIFVFEKPEIQETTMARVPYDKLLSNQTCPSHTEEYCTLVILVWTLLHSIFSSTMFNQYSPVWPSSSSVSKSLIFPSCYLYFDLPFGPFNIQHES